MPSHPFVSRGDAPAGRAPSRLLHLPVALLFALLSVWLTWPLASQLSTHIPGLDLSDNVQFLWNVWWMRRVVAGEAADFFSTDALFHPGGVDIVLHTHTALNSLLGATVLGRLSLPAALNATILINGALNGYTAYLLAWRVSRHRAGAVTAGLFFAASPPLAATMVGHFNFHTAWGVPLTAWAWLETLDRRSLWWAAASGLLLAVVAYSDYYYFVYLCVFLALALGHAWLRPVLHVRTHSGGPSRFDRALLVTSALAAAGAIAVALTGGLAFEVSSVRVSLRTGTNLRALATFAVIWWAWRRYRPAMTWQPATGRMGRDAGLAVIALGVCGLLIAPLLLHAGALWRDGQYVTQTYFWRSAPPGADAASLVLGNPFNRFWGVAVQRLYDALGMRPYDGPFWLGAVPLVLFATRTRWLLRSGGPEGPPPDRGADARLWLLVLGVFFIWAIGPYLVVFGVNTGLPMPQTVLRFLPVVANARVPGHAVIFVHLSAAVLLAMAVAAFDPRRRRVYVAALAAVILIDFAWPSVRTTRLDRPPVYEQLAALPPGAVLEVPLGIRDGFGEDGLMDVSTLYYQTLHEKPIASGYVSRLPPGVKARYAEPPFDTLLTLSAGRPLEVPLPAGAADAVAERLAGLGFRYVVLNRSTATEPVRAFVLAMPLTLLLDDGQRQLYRLEAR